MTAIGFTLFFAALAAVICWHVAQEAWDWEAPRWAVVAVVVALILALSMMLGGTAALLWRAMP